MAKDDLIQLEGVVEKEHPGGLFQVLLSSGTVVKVKMCGRMRHNKIKVLAGDTVVVGLSEYDPTSGFLLYRGALKEANS